MIPSVTSEGINKPPYCEMHLCCDSRHCVSYQCYPGILKPVNLNSQKMFNFFETGVFI